MIIVPWIIRRIANFIILSIGILLPWKLRCKYAELVFRLEAGKISDFLGKKETRSFDMFIILGKTYMQEGKVDLAIENLNKALIIAPSINKAKDIHLLLADCYKTKGELDRYADEVAIWFRNGKSHPHK